MLENFTVIDLIKTRSASVCTFTGNVVNTDEKTAMFDLVGRQRNTVAPDLPDYIMGRDYVAAALRTARDLNAGEAEWLKFVEDLKKREG